MEQIEKNILIISPLWVGIENIYYGKSAYAKGMPGFVNIINGLQNAGYNVSIVFLLNHKQKVNNKLKFFMHASVIKNVKLIQFKYKYFRLFEIILNYIRISKEIFKILIKNNNFLFIYGHSHFAEPANLISKFFKIPYGCRIYGTFLYFYFKQKGIIRTIIANFNEVLAYITKKSFILMTNDGTCGDKVIYKINKIFKNKYDFYFYVNGIDTIYIDINKINNIIKTYENENYILYVGRIAKWKRQDKAIEVINNVNDKNLKLLFVGQEEEEYKNELLKMIDKYGLQDRIIFLGALEIFEILYLAKNALGCLSLYDYSNFSNVFLELLKNENIIITQYDEMVSKYIINNYNGFIVNNYEQCAGIIDRLANIEYRNNIMNNLKLHNIEFKTWENRIDKEIQIIEKYIKKMP